MAHFRSNRIGVTLQGKIGSAQSGSRRSIERQCTAGSGCTLPLPVHAAIRMAAAPGDAIWVLAMFILPQRA